MRIISKWFLLIFVCGQCGGAGAIASEQDHHNHEEPHVHNATQTTLIAAQNETKLASERIKDFAKDLTSVQIAIVQVQGMVCDFCARGIEKTFMKTKGVIRIDVSLAEGQVLIAYKAGQNIDFDDIKTKIQNNGQTAVGLEIVSV